VLVVARNMKRTPAMLFRYRLAVNVWGLLLLLGSAAWAGAFCAWRYQRCRLITERVRYGGAAIATADMALDALCREQDQELRSKSCWKLRRILEANAEVLARDVLANPRLAPQSSVNALVLYQVHMERTKGLAEKSAPPAVPRPVPTVDLLVAEALGAWLSKHSDVAEAAMREWSALRLDRLDHP
jgi:hypothetical protein